MALDFHPGGSQDLQRDPQWGIPDDSVVHAYVSGASHYLGFVNGLTGIPLELSEKGGGITNGGTDNSGPQGVSQQNHANLLRGYADATAAPAWLTNDFGYGSQGQIPPRQIGDGRSIPSFVSSLSGIDPNNPTQPAARQKANGPLGLLSNDPMPDWPVAPPIFNTR